jgi:hypothetical protein
MSNTNKNRGNNMKLKNTILAVSATLFGSAAMAGGTCDIANLSAWTTFNNPASKIDVTAAAAMGGTQCGLAVTTAAQPGGQATKHYVQDSSPVDEPRYRGAFCLDPNSVSLNTSGANRRLKIHNVQCSTDANCANTDIVQFKVENDSVDGLRFDMFVRDTNAGNAANKNRNFIPIPDAPTRVEYDLDLSAGTFKLWLNATSEGDTPVLDLSGLGTSLWTGVDRARLGSQDRSGNVPADQVFYIDEFESRRATFIGGGCANP